MKGIAGLQGGGFEGLPLWAAYGGVSQRDVCLAGVLLA